MNMSYKVGTKIWAETGNLLHEDKISLIAAMETNILRHKIEYPDESFYWLIVSFEESRDNAKSFTESKECTHYIEWLEWLRRKNMALEYRRRLDEILDRLDGEIPTDQINELRDTYEELTVLL